MIDKKDFDYELLDVFPKERISLEPTYIICFGLSGQLGQMGTMGTMGTGGTSGKSGHVGIDALPSGIFKSCAHLETININTN